MYAGIDAGSLSFKIVLAEDEGLLRKTVYHEGEPLKAFNSILEQFRLDNAVITGRYGALISGRYRIPSADPVRALLYNQQSSVSRIVDIGASRLSMIELKGKKFHRLNTNSLCASGTGAFLDQQMKRMGLDYSMLEGIDFIEDPPSIATRCAVFAKSDLIHRQQEGYPVKMLWNGLVRGMAESAFSTLFRGKNISGDILLIGGLANNRIFAEYLKRLCDPACLVVPQYSSYYQAESNLLYCQNNKEHKKYFSIPGIAKTREKPLLIETEKIEGHFWEMDCYGNEADIYSLKKGLKEEVFIGVDIGSTSTKLVAGDRNGKILFGLYNRTGGRPVEAMKNLLRGIKRLIHEYSLELRIKAIGTTGSGRKLVGHFIGADMIINEITAHLKGAVKEYPRIQTIFEIGGQDSKYISVEDGWMKDASMNYVCAAGTGSFIEEQALNLGLKLEDIEKLCNGVSPPVSSDRCTVFMEQDAVQLLINGFSKSEVMASMLYSVCRNYLHRVVQSRPVREPVLFLGATSKNKGLVRAFENIMQKRVYTSVYGHITGAIGVAEALRKTPPLETRFRGLGISEAEVDLSEANCGLCANRCRITHMNMPSLGKALSWGYMCGKEPEETSARKVHALRYLKELESSTFDSTEKRNAGDAVYYPRALQFYSHYPLWEHFFKQLGINIIPSMQSGDKTARLSREYAISDFCYPLKLSIGHVVNLVKDNKMPVFLPCNIQDTPNPKTRKSHFCPISQGLPSIIKNTLQYNNLPSDFLLSPVVDFEKSLEENSESICRELRRHFSFSRKSVKEAFRKAVIYYDSMILKRIKRGREIITEHRKKKVNSLVLLGRPYNIFDGVLNQKIPRSLSRFGLDIIPGDFIPVERSDIGPDTSDLYWAYSQHLAACAEFIRDEPGLYPVYLTNFSCGPDSFLLSLLEKIMGKKPFLVLELDELGGDAGYITRLEAFYDRIEACRNRSPEKEEKPSLKINLCRSINGHRLFIPPMHPFATKLLSHAFRAFDIEAVAMLKEDMHTFSLGRSVVRGSECMPAASTIGSFLHYIESSRVRGKAKNLLFMPCTSGPCRFGQYARLHGSIISDRGIDAEVFSPSSEDNYGSLGGRLRIHLLKSVIVADVLTKLGCALRPWETKGGETDAIIAKYTGLLAEAFEKRADICKLLKSLSRDLHSVNTDRKKKKPLIGIVGEIYVRNSPFSNNNLIGNIEKNGGEAWLCSSLEWMYYTGYIWRLGRRTLCSLLKNSLSARILSFLEHRYMNIFSDMLKSRREPDITQILDAGKEYIPLEFTGEAILTIGRGIHFIKQGADMIVNVSPFTCMPGAISSAIFRNISKIYKVPVISVFYDGETDFNELLSTYINNIN